jgi:hypothetical protein
MGGEGHSYSLREARNSAYQLNALPGQGGQVLKADIAQAADSDRYEEPRAELADQ